jgi:ribosomal 50S subunit-associated protein YjgA (DUF615 family)
VREVTTVEAKETVTKREYCDTDFDRRDVKAVYRLLLPYEDLPLRQVFEEAEEGSAGLALLEHMVNQREVAEEDSCDAVRLYLSLATDRFPGGDRDRLRASALVLTAICGDLMSSFPQAPVTELRSLVKDTKLETRLALGFLDQLLRRRVLSPDMTCFVAGSCLASKAAEWPQTRRRSWWPWRRKECGDNP